MKKVRVRFVQTRYVREDGAGARWLTQAELTIRQPKDVAMFLARLIEKEPWIFSELGGACALRRIGMFVRVLHAKNSMLTRRWESR